MLRSKDIYNKRLEVANLRRVLKIAEQELANAIDLNYNPIAIKARENTYRGIKAQLKSKLRSLEVLTEELEPDRVPAWKRPVPKNQICITSY